MKGLDILYGIPYNNLKLKPSPTAEPQNVVQIYIYIYPYLNLARGYYSRGHEGQRVISPRDHVIVKIVFG